MLSRLAQSFRIPETELHIKKEPRFKRLIKIMKKFVSILEAVLRIS